MGKIEVAVLCFEGRTLKELGQMTLMEFHRLCQREAVNSNASYEQVMLVYQQALRKHRDQMRAYGQSTTTEKSYG